MHAISYAMSNATKNAKTLYYMMYTVSKWSKGKDLNLC